MKKCKICEHCDTNRMNDLGQVRCKRNHTYVNADDSCDCFAYKFVDSSELISALHEANITNIERIMTRSNKYDL